MLSRLMRYLFVSMAFIYVYQNRYKLMNRLLENEKIRHFAVTNTMKVPFLRNMFLQSTFRT